MPLYCFPNFLNVALKELYIHPHSVTYWIKILPNRVTTRLDVIQTPLPAQLPEVPPCRGWLLLMFSRGSAAVAILPLAHDQAVDTDRANAASTTVYNIKLYHKKQDWGRKNVLRFSILVPAQSSKLPHCHLSCCSVIQSILS